MNTPDFIPSIRAFLQMRISKPARVRMHLAFLSACVALSFATSMRAQGAPAAAPTSGSTGSIIGTVTDRSTKLSLSGARVSVVNTTIEAFTNQQGFYQLANVPAGQVTIEVAYVGYETLSIDETVIAGKGVRLDAAFNSSTFLMNPVVITGELVGTARAINQERAAPSLTDVVASDAIGQLPDKNVAEALERIPGVDIYRDKGEGRFVEIRGLDPVYIGVSFNGIRASSTDKGTREVVLDVISSDMIADLEVNKVNTPDMDADAMGGSVNVKTRSGLDQQGVQAMFSVGTNDSKQDQRYGGYNASGYYGNTFDDGRLGVFVGVTFEDRPFSVNNSEAADPWYPVLSPTTGQTVQLFGGQDFRDYLVARWRHGIDGSLDFKIDATSTVYLRYTMSYYTERDNYWVTEIPFQSYSSLLALTDTSATVVLPAKTILKEGVSVVNSKISTSLVGGYDKTFGDFTNNFAVGYTLGKYTRPTVTLAFANTKAMTLSYAFSDPWHDTITQQAGPNFNDPAQYAFSTKSAFTNTQAGTHEKTVKDDLKKDFEVDGLPAFLKIGVEYRNKNDFEQALKDGITSVPFTYASEAFGTPDSEYPWGGFQSYQLNPQANQGFYSANGNVYPTTLNVSTTDLGSYSSMENIGAGYLMGGITAGKLKILAGARIEDTDFSIQGWQSEATKTATTYSEVYYSRNYDNVLPDVVMTYEFDPRTIARASWTNSIARPDYSDTIPGRTVDDVNHLVTQGNPELPALTAMNWDASLEHYFSSLGAVSVAFFYKDINNFAYQAQSGTDPSTGYLLTTYYTAPKAWIYGTEFTWRQRFGFLPHPLDGLGIEANLTLGDSQATYPTRPGENLPFVGYAKEISNVALTYERRGLKFDLAVNHHSPRVEVDSALGANATQDLYEDSFTELDFGSSYILQDHVQFYFNVANITNAPLREYYGGTAWKRLSQYEEYGPSFEGGMRWFY
jgi:TonB-dependent receptor